MKLKRIIAIDYHRNGIDGAPFHAVLFDDSGDEGSRKLGIVFDEPFHVAVFDVAKLAAGNITFGENSWRGDRFEPALRQAISRWFDANAKEIPIVAVPINSETNATRKD
jgi:hypothetical protein